MNRNHVPYPQPWNPSCNIPPHQWDRMEENRVRAWRIRNQRASFPPTSSNTPSFPLVPPAWSYQHRAPFSHLTAPVPPSNNHTVPIVSSNAPVPLSNNDAVPIASINAPAPAVVPQALSDITNNATKSPVKKKAKSTNASANSTSSSPLAPRNYNNFWYTWHKALAKGFERFKCTFHRNTDCKGCNAVIKVKQNDDGTETIIAEGNHADGCIRRNGRTVRTVAVEESSPVDYTSEMKQFVEERATSDDHRNDLPNKIWSDTVAHFRENYGQNFTGMTKSQVTSLVYNCRKSVFGGDVVSKVEQMYSGDQNKAFLWHHSSFVDKNGMQRMMCFSLPQLLALLMYPAVSSLLTTIIWHSVLNQFTLLFLGSNVC